MANTELTVERVPVIFAIGELWLLHDFVRHESPDAKAWRYPPACEDLNDEIAFAIDCCETHSLTEYTLMLSRGDLLTIDYFIRRDHKTPEGASGKRVLLKAFRARKELADHILEHTGDDRTFMEVTGHASTRDIDTGKNSA
ncbi:MAG: hypothetical protein ABI559_02595 [Chloroflexota bacterium]